MEKFISWLNKRRVNSPMVLTMGMGLLILIGAVLLNLPIANKTGEDIHFIDALFTATSALCVTGLSVVNTAKYWSLFGQIVIIILIQIGGLGFMTMATIISMLLGKRITLTERLILKEQFNQDTLTGLVRLTKNIIYFTLGVEFLGAMLLSIRFVPMFGLSKGIWYSVFHSISSFCNAGFDILGDSLIDYSSDTLTMTTIALLIIIGGLGYSVVRDWYNHKKFHKLSLHSKVVSIVTAVLLIMGTLIFLLIEFTNYETIGGMNLFDKILNSFFQSTTSRTAGYASVDIGKIREPSAFFLIILMFIGGSPGSTAGGIKTTTIGVIVFSTLATIKGERDVVLFKKRLSDDIIKKALAIIFISLTMIVMMSFVLSLIEEEAFLSLLFETTSAFTTVGLSRGITPELSYISKLILSVAMYIGRVGPLTMAYALGRKEKSSALRYSEGYIMVG